MGEEVEEQGEFSGRGNMQPQVLRWGRAWQAGLVWVAKEQVVSKEGAQVQPFLTGTALGHNLLLCLLLKLTSSSTVASQ